MMIMIWYHLLSKYSTSGAASADQCDYEVFQMQTVTITWNIACNASIYPFWSDSTHRLQSHRSGYSTTASSLHSHVSLTVPSSSTYTAVMVVPTGIGATIGGYAGYMSSPCISWIMYDYSLPTYHRDALPAAKLIATVVDNLITHPNGNIHIWAVTQLAVDAYYLFLVGSLFCIMHVPHNSHEWCYDVLACEQHSIRRGVCIRQVKEKLILCYLFVGCYSMICIQCTLVDLLAER